MRSSDNHLCEYNVSLVIADNARDQLTLVPWSLTIIKGWNVSGGFAERLWSWHRNLVPGFRRSNGRELVLRNAAILQRHPDYAWLPTGRVLENFLGLRQSHLHSGKFCTETFNNNFSNNQM